ncbi:WD40/YVTN/BNR-like repeat-containing protein [Candidatus Bipolaricaulota bacterium]
MKRSVMIGWLCVCVLAATALSAEDNSWEALGPYGASVESLAISPSHPDTVYAAVSSIGVFRSSDGGRSWDKTPLEFDGNISKIAVAPTNSSIVYIATSNGFRASFDGGETWVDRSRGLTSAHLNTVILDPNDPNIMYAGAWGGLFKTTNAGEDWVDVGGSLGDPDVRALAADPAQPGVVYIGTSKQGIFRTADGGASWHPRSEGLEDLLIRDLLIDPGDHQVLYAATNSSGVYRSEDGGESWLPANEGVHGSSFRLACDAQSSGTLYLGTQGTGVFRSTDQGATWQQWGEGLPSGASVYALSIHPDTGEVMVGLFSYGVYRRDSSSPSWTASNTSMTGYVVSSLIAGVGSDELLVGIETYGPSIFRSIDGGATWTVSRQGMSYPPVYSLVQDRVDPFVLYSGNGGSLYRSMDGGLTWARSDSGLERGFVSAYALLIDRQVPCALFTGTNSGIWTSTDCGETWGAQQLPETTIRSLAQSPSTPNLLIAGGERGSLYTSADGGHTWVLSNEGLSGSVTIRAITFDPLLPQTLYVGTGGAGIFRSDDAGRTWAPFSTAPEMTRTFALLALDGSGELLAGSAQGVFAYEPSTATWHAVGSGLPDGTLIQLLVYDQAADLIFAGGENGLFRIRWDP